MRRPADPRVTSDAPHPRAAPFARRLALLLMLATPPALVTVGFLTRTRNVHIAELAGLAVILLATASYLLVVEHRRADQEGRITRTLAAIDYVAEAALANLDLDQLLDDLLTRLRTITTADAAAVFVIEDENTLALRASQGFGAAGRKPTRIPVGQGLVGRIAAAREPIAHDDLQQSDIVWHAMREQLQSSAGAPLMVNGAVVGVLIVGYRLMHRHSAQDIRLIRVIAERTASAVERARLLEAERKAHLAVEHARRHLELVVRGSEVLVHSPYDYEQALGNLVDAAIPSFADFGAVYIADASAHVRLLTAQHVDETLGEQVDTLGELGAVDLNLVWSLMARGASSLVTDVAGRAASDPFIAAMAQLRLNSFALAPIRVRGLAFGAIVYGTAGGRRGYRPSDARAVEQLAARASLAIERALLYREARDTAALSVRHAERLRQLLEAGLGITAGMTQQDVLSAALAWARRTQETRAAHITLRGDPPLSGMSCAPGAGDEPVADPVWAYLARIGVPCRSGDPSLPVMPAEVASVLGDSWLAAPLRMPPDVGGWLLVVGKPDADTSDEDLSLLTLLAQMVSAALVNAYWFELTQRGEARLSAIINASPVAIVDIDPDGNLVNWNPAASFLMTVTDDAELTPTFMPAVAGALTDLVHRARQTGEPQTDEITVALEDDVTKYLSVSVSPVVQPDSSVAGLLLLATDETVRRQLADQVQRAQRLEAVGRLAGGVAHDFNNLLTVIVGYADTLLRSLPEESADYRRVAAIHRAGSRGATLTQRLLTISRREVVHPVVLSPAGVILELEDMLRRVVGDEIHLDLRISGPQPAVLIDRDHLDQVVLNLVVNARDAMPDGGELTVQTRLVELPGDEDESSRYAALIVRDTGVGMDEETREHCFDPFFTTKGPGRGTGLGLAAVYGIVTQSGGTITVHSRPGEGTTFTILLPAADAPLHVATAAPAPRVPSYEREARVGHVLLVEDDQDVRDVVRTMIEQNGYVVHSFSGGSAALAFLENYAGDLDVVVTDVSMPDMPGPELARRVQERRPVEVIYISGYPERVVAEGMDAADAPSVLLKPFSPTVLAERLAAATDRNHQGSNR